MVRPEGHCNDDTVWDEFSSQPKYASPIRDGLTMANQTDFELANAVFLADRHSFELLIYQTAAKERIRWLSIQLAKALERLGETCCDEGCTYFNTPHSHSDKSTL